METTGFDQKAFDELVDRVLDFEPLKPESLVDRVRRAEESNPKNSPRKRPLKRLSDAG